MGPAGQNERSDYDLGLEQRWKFAGIERGAGNGLVKGVLRV